MDSNTPVSAACEPTLRVKTAYGEVPLQALMDAYEKKKQYEQSKKVWLKTDAGREYQRKKAKQYYEKNREKVLAKRAARYTTDHETLLNRAKEYYSTHSEECKERNRLYREQKRVEGVSKNEAAEA